MFVNRDDIEVNARGIPLVEFNFFLAIQPPVFQRRIIDEIKMNRLFDLVSKITGQNDPGNMSFHHRQTGNRVRKGGWLE